MKNPNYQKEIVAFVFLWLGVAFVLCGTLAFLGLLLPSEHSLVQDPLLMGRIFCFSGTGLCAVQAVLIVMAGRQNIRQNEIIACGVKTSGIVEDVRRQYHIKWKKQVPYRVNYTYEWQGKIHHDKSRLLWEAPNMTQGQRIEVFVDEQGKSAVAL